MKFLAVHPSGLMYTRIYLRLEPLGLENVAEAVRRAGHSAQLIDLQVETRRDYLRILDDWQPDVVAFSCNYLANIPEIVDLARDTRERLPGCFVFAGGHSASFTAEELLEHGRCSIDCVLRGEGEVAPPLLLRALEEDRTSLSSVPGIVSRASSSSTT